jgi:DNA-binding response OmpR family regulator
MSRDRDPSASSSARMHSGVRELVGAEILVCDQDDKVTKGLTTMLSAANLHVTTEIDPAVAVSQLDKRFFSVVVIDLDTPTPNAGIEFTRQIKQMSPTSMVIVLTPRKSYSDTVAAIRAGAMDVILKSPDSVGYLKERIMEAAFRSVDKREVSSVLNDVREVHEEFLQRFMEAERRALDLADRVAGRTADDTASDEQIRILVVEPAGQLAGELQARQLNGFEIETVSTGGEALDRVSNARFHIALVADELPDLPGSMVVRSIKTQNPDLVAISYMPGGVVEIVESARTILVVERFTDTQQLVDRLPDLTQAFRVKSRERRYTQAFRERHYDFLRRYVELKSKIERALAGS